MDEALRAKLLADTALAGLVTKVAWDELPQDKWLTPGKGALLLTMATPGREYSHDGHDGLDTPLVQIDVWARDPDVARAITLAIPAAIEPEEAISGWRIGPSFLEAERVSREDLGGAPIFRRSQDWSVSARPV